MLPGEPPIRLLAAHALGLASPKEGAAKTKEWPAPSAAAGQGGLLPNAASSSTALAGLRKRNVPEPFAKLPV